MHDFDKPIPVFETDLQGSQHESHHLFERIMSVSYTYR